MRHRRRLMARAAAVVGAMALLLTAVAAVLGVHDEGFQLEGNPTAADLTYVDIDDTNPGNPVNTVLTPGSLTGVFAGALDWNSLFDNSGPNGVGNEKALPAGFDGSDFVPDFHFSGSTFLTYDETTFATGSKDTLDIPDWQCNRDNNVNSKTDIVNGYAALYSGSGDDILYFGLEKDVDNGTNNVGLWLFQDPDVGCSSPSGSVDFSGVHMPGDLFVVSAFTNGGGVANITAYQWVADADSSKAGNQPGLDPNPVDNLVNGDCLDTAASDRLCAVVNGKNVTMPWRSADSSVIDAPKVSPNFFEGGINLDQFDEFANSCFTGFMLETRSSQSLDATLFDYVLGNIDNCHPDIQLDKEPETQTHNVGESFDWTLDVTNTGTGDANGAVVSDTIPDGLTINSVTVDPAAAGDCDVTGQDVECTVDVAIGDTVTITVNVTSTTDVFGSSEAGCVTVTNTGTVSVDGDLDTSNNSDSADATICRPLVSKTADGSYTHDVQWTLTKDVAPDSHSMLAGESEDSTYTVSVDKTVTDSDFAVAGTITIENPSAEDAMTVSVADELSSGETASTITCDGGADPTNLTIAAGATVECDYVANPAGATAGTNTATVTLNSIDFSATAGYTFTATNTGEPESITVEDAFDGGTADAIGGASDDTTFATYDRTFACSTDEADYTNGHYQYTKANTATIVETVGDSDSETVTVDCYFPLIEKTASASYTHGVDWTIEKSVDVDQHTLLAGQSEDSNYTVTVTKDVTDANFAVTGTITVTNPSPDEAMTVDVTDELSSGESASGADLDCGAAGDGSAVVVPAAGSVVCSYELAPADATAGSNTATATFTNDSDVEASATVPYAFSVTNTGEPETVDVVDNFDGTETALGTVSSTTTFTSYAHSFSCPTDETLYTNGHYAYTKDNTASIVQTDDEDSESVDTDCYIPTISKTADGSFDRDWDWTIDKSADATELTLMLDQSYLVNYTVVVTPTKTDSNFDVTGSITVANPSPEDDMTVDVTDQLSTGQSLAATAIDCGTAGDGDNAVVPAGGSITCSYLVDDVSGVTANQAGTNTATATFSDDGDVSVSDDDGYSYDLDSETDECVDVTDTIAGDLGTVCAGDPVANRTFEYTYDVAQSECGDHQVDNTASFTTNDQDGEGDDAGSDDWTVIVHIECQNGCTLTQGYWKTHSEYGPAPYDDTWALLDALRGTGQPLTWAPDGQFDGADELFFSPKTTMTWYQVFWIAPGGNAYYQLAHQYEAAVLNVLNGADAPQNVVDAIAHAETLFETYTPAQIGALKGNKPVRKDFITTAGILGAYNTGDIGPGHCDEDTTSSVAP